MLTLVMSALAGGDHIDHANALRAGGTGRVLGFTVKAASTLGTFLRCLTWGRVRQLGDWRDGSPGSARRVTLHLPARRPWAERFLVGLMRIRA